MSYAFYELRHSPTNTIDVLHQTQQQQVQFLTYLSMTRFGLSIGPMTFPTSSVYATCYATDVFRLLTSNYFYIQISQGAQFLYGILQRLQFFPKGGHCHFHREIGERGDWKAFKVCCIMYIQQRSFSITRVCTSLLYSIKFRVQQRFIFFS